MGASSCPANIEREPEGSCRFEELAGVADLQTTLDRIALKARVDELADPHTAALR